MAAAPTFAKQEKGLRKLVLKRQLKEGLSNGLLRKI
jgi:hypothetical protein